MSRPPLPPPPAPPPPRAENNHLERRSVTVTRAALPADALHEQHVVPRNSLFIDLLVWGAAADSPVWGPFRPFFAGRRVAVEFCSGHLSLDMLNSYFAKAQLVNPEGTLPGEARLFILCNHRPEARLRELARFVTPGPVAGSWCIDLGAAGQAIIAVATELPDQPGNSCLRFAVAKPPHAEHLSRLFAVARDTTIPEHLRIEAIRSTYMLDEARSHFSEHPIWHDLLAELGRQTPRILAEQRADAIEQGVAQGIAQGIEQGIEQGVDKAVEDLLAAAAQLLPPETIEELRLQRDPVAIALAMAGIAK